MKIKGLLSVIAFAGGLLASNVASADESLWLYTKGTDTRPQGTFELKLSNISRIGKSSGDYVFNDIRPEIEYGITDSLTITAEIMIFDHNYSVNDPNLQPMHDTQGGDGGRFNETQIGGYEIGLKYNVLSPYKDYVGLSFGLSYDHRDKYRLDGADITQNSVAATVFLQKNFLDDTLIFAINPKIELERRTSPDVLEEEISLEISAGVAYRVAPKWFVGLEFRHQSDYLSPEELGVTDPGLHRSSWDLDDFRIGSQHQNGNYFGPTVHYAQKDWWVTAGVLAQVWGGGSQHSYSEGGKNWDEHERIHAGVTVAYNF